MRIQKLNSFAYRHIGISPEDEQAMLKEMRVNSMDELISKTIPANIRIGEMNLPDALTEYSYLQEIKKKASQNKVYKTYIGMGYYNTITPAVIRRNIFENPGWYTQYTPYQAEIAQGRLESLLNFQTLISDLTGLPIANASLLDDATAAAEAMSMFFNAYNKKEVVANKFFIDLHCFPQIIDILKTRALPLNIELVIGDYQTIDFDQTFFGALVQFPNAEGSIEDYAMFTKKVHDLNAYVVVVADLMSLALICEPGQWGADCVVGNTQRFGVPMGFGGPHAAYFATTDDFKRVLPGRIIGVSVDRLNNQALRMALQTREQHIRREKATSNICTAQALLANIAAMYAVYHGAEGIKAIATSIHEKTKKLAIALEALNFKVKHQVFFDTLTIETDLGKALRAAALTEELNFFYTDKTIQISLDETTSSEDLKKIIAVFKAISKGSSSSSSTFAISSKLIRTSAYLQQEVFTKYRSETELMRYIKRLENKDLSLTHAMIPLG